MSKIDLKKLKGLSGLKTFDFAKVIFPNHKHPNRAYSRVVEGLMFLTTKQVETLAELLGVPEGLIYEGADWAMSTNPAAPSCIIFKTYDYVAHYDTNSHTTSLSNSTGVMFEKIQHDHGMHLSEYERFLTELIIKYKQK